MKFIRLTVYYIIEAAKGISRNALMSATSAATVAACSFIIVLSFCVASNVDYVLEQLEQSVGLSVIIDDELPPERVGALYEALLGVNHVASAEYVSSRQALEDFSRQLGEDGLLSGFENDNPLPRSFTLSLDDIREQKAVIAAINAPEMRGLGAAKIRDASDLTDILSSIGRGVRIATLAAALLLAVLSVVIIMNAVELAMNARRDEINIMKYVGATDWFIRVPFVLEGAAIGLIGALVPSVACLFGYNALIDLFYDKFPSFADIIKLRSGGDVFPAATLTASLLGSGLGVLGSVTSIRKYLDV